MAGRLSSTAWVGLGLVFTGIAWFGGWWAWEATRIWEPLDVPVSLSVGHVRTAEFKINVESTYAIGIAVNRNFDYVGIPCLIGVQQCEGNRSVLSASWSVSKSGRVEAKGTSEVEHGDFWLGTETIGRIIGTFHTNSGRYILDLNLLQDGSRLDERAPHLVVLESGGEYARTNDQVGLAFLVFLSIGAAGSYALVRSAVVCRRKKLAAWARACSMTQPGPQPRELHLSSQPLAPLAVRTRFRPPPAAWLGALLLISGLAAYAAAHHWMATRTFVAVDMPVSLRTGHLRTGPFPINLRESYTVLVDMDYNHWFSTNCSEYSMLQTRWVLYRGGEVAAKSHEPFIPGADLEDFPGEVGTYDLDVEVLKDASCLGFAHPRRRVYTDKGRYAFVISRLLGLFAISMGAGASLLLIAGADHFRKPLPPVTLDFGSGIIRRHLPLKRKPSKGQLISGFSSYGLIAANTYLVILIPVWVMISGEPRVQGLVVHLAKPGIAAQSTPGIQPLRVRVEAAAGNVRARLYVDSRLVSWEDFEAVLQSELNRRPPNWPVYVEGSGDMEWGNAVRAIDTIRGLQAQVVLLTPSTASGR